MQSRRPYQELPSLGRSPIRTNGGDWRACVLQSRAMTLSRSLVQWFDWESHQGLLFTHPFILTCPVFFFFTVLFMVKVMNGSTSSTPKLDLPPSPPKLPIIGNLHQLGILLHRRLDYLSKKYGPLMILHLGYVPTLVVSSAEMAREIKTTHDIPFANRPFTTAGKILLYGCSNLAFTPYGEYWRKVRKITVMELLNTKKVQSFKYVREEEVSLMIESISYSSSIGAEVNITNLAMGVANDIICRCSLGRKHEGKDGKNNIGEIAGNLVQLMTAFSFGDLFPWMGWMDHLTGLISKINKLSKQLDSFFDEIIEEHVIQHKHDHLHKDKDFVDLLLQVPNDDGNFTRNNIKAVLLDSFVGGTETVATTIEWAMAELVKNPTMMQKVQEEVRRVVGKKHKLDEEDIQHMEYFKSVIKETLRFHPPGSLILFESSIDTNVKGYHIPAKTKVILNVWSIQRDPNKWDRAEEFIPDRFRNSPIDFRGQDMKFIPFGSGRRGCPGISFGTAVVEIVVANLLYWFNWETPDGKELDMAEGFGITVNRKIPLRLVPVRDSYSVVK